MESKTPAPWQEFDKKRVRIKAFQWLPHMGEIGPVYFHPPGILGRKPVVDTLERRHLEVSKGDWIICGIAGEFYPCKPHIFQASYSSASEPIAPDTAKEQAGRKMFEALETMLAASSGMIRIIADSKRLTELHQHWRNAGLTPGFVDKAKAALAAGREAAWGQ